MLADVVTVTLTVVGVDPFSVTDAGTAQVAPAGAPVQLRATFWLKPPTGETEIE
jgi:hypothetical protein